MSKITKKLFIILLLFPLIIGCSKETSEENNSQENNSTENTTTETTVEEPKEYTEREKMLLKLSELLDTKEAFDTGSYVKGDIPAGEYAFVKFEGSGSYYSEEDAAGNIIDNENFDSFGYVKVHASGDLETYGVLVKVSALNKLGVKGAKELYEILNETSNWNQAGYYKVGVDIAPGKYIVESIGSGYYAVLPVGNNEIIKNDNYNGKKTVNLNKGQYLELSRSTITKAK